MSAQLDGNPDWHFKATPGGYVFQMPRPALVGPLRHYLVDGERKALIGHLLQQSMWFSFLVMAVLLVLFLGAMASFHDLMRPTTLGHALAVIGGTALVLVLACALSNVYLQWRLRPVLKDVPLTDQRISLGEKWRNVGATTSNGSIGLGIVAGLVLVLVGVVVHTVFSMDPAKLTVACFNMIAGVAMASPYVALACVKAHQR